MNDPLVRLLFLAHLGSCLFMVGAIWIVQVVHYPLFDSIGVREFPIYAQRHVTLITGVVAPTMLIEGVTAVLLFWCRPAGVSLGFLGTGLVLLAVIWLSTAFVQVPCHDVFTQGFDSVVHQRLVSTNWIRTTAWSLRGALVLWMTWSSLR